MAVWMETWLTKYTNKKSTFQNMATFHTTIFHIDAQYQYSLLFTHVAMFSAWLIGQTGLVCIMCVTILSCSMI